MKILSMLFFSALVLSACQTSSSHYFDQEPKVKWCDNHGDYNEEKFYSQFEQ